MSEPVASRSPYCVIRTPHRPHRCPSFLRVKGRRVEDLCGGVTADEAADRLRRG